MRRMSVRHYGKVGLVLMFMSACASNAQYQRASAGPTGCPPQEIEISDQDQGFGTASWTATCRNMVYQCSGVQGSITCRPASGTASTPTESAVEPDTTADSVADPEATDEVESADAVLE